MEEDNPKIDHYKTVTFDEFLANLNRIFQNVKGCMEMGVSVNLQEDTTKLQEGKITIRVFIDMKQKAPPTSTIIPNPFENLPECEEPNRE